MRRTRFMSSDGGEKRFAFEPLEERALMAFVGLTGGDSVSVPVVAALVAGPVSTAFATGETMAVAAELPKGAQQAAAILPAQQPWHNEKLPNDVNGDGWVTNADALLIVAILRTRGPGKLPAISPPGPPHVDVNHDGSLTSLDALLVISEVRANSRRAENLLGARKTAEASSSETITPLQEKNPRSEFAAPLLRAKDAVDGVRPEAYVEIIRRD